MKEITLKEGHILAPFFESTYDSCPEAFTDGIMGRGFCDSADAPTYGIIKLGEFCYLGGDGSGSQKKNLPSILQNLFKEPLIFVPLSESWNQQLYNNPSYCKKVRYALDRPDIDSFDTDKLLSYLNRITEKRNNEFKIKPINENLFFTVQKEEWSKDFTANYSDYLAFKENALGFVIIETASGRIAAGASSYSSSLNSIEIVIATSKDFRNQGLATAVSAKLLLECMKQNKYPRWDAANLTSVSVAKKLGYHFEEEYICYIPI